MIQDFNDQAQSGYQKSRLSIIYPNDSASGDNNLLIPALNRSNDVNSFGQMTNPLIMTQQTVTKFILIYLAQEDADEIAGLKLGVPMGNGNHTGAANAYDHAVMGQLFGQFRQRLIGCPAILWDLEFQKFSIINGDHRAAIIQGLLATSTGKGQLVRPGHISPPNDANDPIWILARNNGQLMNIPYGYSLHGVAHRFVFISRKDAAHRGNVFNSQMI
jgi:hypothetical protein